MFAKSKKLLVWIKLLYASDYWMQKKTLPRAFTHDSIFFHFWETFVHSTVLALFAKFFFSYKCVFFYWIAGRAELKYCVTAPHWSNCVIGGPYIRSYGIKQIFFNKNICPFFFTLFQIPHIVAKHNEVWCLCRHTWCSHWMHALINALNWSIHFRACWLTFLPFFPFWRPLTSLYGHWLAETFFIIFFEFHRSRYPYEFAKFSFMFS